MPRARIDITGQRFGRLRVLRVLQTYNPDRHLLWECRCDCGLLHVVKGENVRHGGTQSCGCLAREIRKHPNPQRREVARALRAAG